MVRCQRLRVSIPTSAGGEWFAGATRRNAVWWAGWCLLAGGVGPRLGAQDLQRLEATEPRMGTSVRVVVYAADGERARAAMQRAFARIGELDDRLSDYRADSESMRLCASAPHRGPVDVSDDLWRVLRFSAELSERTAGAFDVSIGPFTRLWRRARRQGELPTAAELDALRPQVGYRLVEVDSHSSRVRLAAAGMRLDFGGIAKGYAAQEALRVLSDGGFPNAMVAASGDIAVGEPPPGEPGWRIGVAALQAGGPPRRYLRLTQAVVTTSGDLSQFLEVGGVRYSHILDPRTGQALTVRRSVTVVGRDGLAADGLATALSVLGPDDVPRLAELYGIEALVQWLEGDDLRTMQTPGWAADEESKTPPSTGP